MMSESSPASRPPPPGDPSSSRSPTERVRGSESNMVAARSSEPPKCGRTELPASTAVRSTADAERCWLACRAPQPGWKPSPLPAGSPICKDLAGIGPIGGGSSAPCSKRGQRTSASGERSSSSPARWPRARGTLSSWLGDGAAHCTCVCFAASGLAHRAPLPACAPSAAAAKARDSESSSSPARSGWRSCSPAERTPLPLLASAARAGAPSPGTLSLRAKRRLTKFRPRLRSSETFESLASAPSAPECSSCRSELLPSASSMSDHSPPDSSPPPAPRMPPSSTSAPPRAAAPAAVCARRLGAAAASAAWDLPGAAAIRPRLAQRTGPIVRAPSAPPAPPPAAPSLLL
mmetsp:Transcript_17618/g.40924  ORF Transcript_17618/g.40924 Transcript_17618/m.40924 type:complete len:347 (-) Transcript_17618:429-1469(-)